MVMNISVQDLPIETTPFDPINWAKNMWVMAFSPDTKRMAVAPRWGKYVWLVDLETKKTRWVANPPEQDPPQVRWWWPTTLFGVWCLIAWRLRARRVPSNLKSELTPAPTTNDN
jgi:hypothetical protein